MGFSLASYAINFGRIIGTIASVASAIIGSTVLLVIAAIAAIGCIGYLIYKNWDTICDFFSSIGNGITQMATIVWEWATLRAVTVTIPPPAIDWPWPIPKERTIPKDEPIAIPIAISTTKVKPKTRRREKDIYSVYDIHVNIAGFYREYTRGQGYKKTFLNIGNIYKYGLTSLKSVYLRYSIISELYHLDKERYIFDKLSYFFFLSKEWYLHNVNYAIANAKEVQLIDSYAIRHGKYPPGNTFRG